MLFVTRFTWDPRKAAKVAREHGIRFEDIQDIFRDPFAVEFFDEQHSDAEDRYGIIGLTAAYGLIYLAFVETSNEIRFVTARRAETWMVRDYEQKRSRT